MSGRVVCVHWPARHHTVERVAALAAAVSDHPGVVPVRVDTQRGVVELGVACAGDRPSRLAIVDACQVQVTVHIIDGAAVGFDEDERS